MRVEMGGMNPIADKSKLVALLVALLVMVWGCFEKDLPLPPTADPEAEPLRIGVCLPMSGDLKAQGEEQWQALCLANTLWPTVRSHRVELVLRDTRGDATGTGEALADLFAQKGIVALIGGVSEAEVRAAQPLLQAHPVPLLVTTAQVPLVRGGTANLWRLGSSLKHRAWAATRLARDRLGAFTAVVVVDPQDSASVRLASMFSALFINQGGAIERMAFLGDASGEAEALAASLAAGRVDVIFAPGGGSLAPLRSALELAIETPLILCGGDSASGALRQGVPKKAHRYVITDFYAAQATSQRAQTYLAQYAHREGRISTGAALAADAYLLVLDALALTREGEPLAEALAAVMGNEYLSGMLVACEDGEFFRYVHVMEQRSRRTGYVGSYKAGRTISAR